MNNLFIKYYFNYHLAVNEEKSNQIFDFAYYEIKIHYVAIIYSFHKFLFSNKNLLFTHKVITVFFTLNWNMLKCLKYVSL